MFLTYLQDTHRHRIGTNYQQLPVNCAYRVSTRNYQRGKIIYFAVTQFIIDFKPLVKFADGPMCVNDNQAGAPNYYPNSFGGPEPVQRARDLEPPYKVSGDVYRFDSGDEDNYSQATIFWDSVLDEAARKRLTDNIADNLSNALVFIQERAVANFAQVSPECGKLLEQALKKKRSEKVQCCGPSSLTTSL